MNQRNKQKRILLLTAMLMFAFAFFRFNTIDAQAASKYTIYVKIPFLNICSNPIFFIYNQKRIASYYNLYNY